jgi:hypothetical protein
MIPKYPTPHQFRAAPLPTTIRIEHDQQSLSRCRGCRAGRYRACMMICLSCLPSLFAFLVCSFPPSLTCPRPTPPSPPHSHTHPPNGQSPRPRRLGAQRTCKPGVWCAWVYKPLSAPALSRFYSSSSIFSKLKSQLLCS